MNFSIVFENSGDSIPFQYINDEVVEVLSYYVENLNNQNVNRFLTDNNLSKRIDDHANKLHTAITECNKFIYELLDQPIDTYNIEEYLDQQNLNKLHADWVNSQTIEYNILEKRKKYKSSQAEYIHDSYPDEIPTPTVGDILNKLNVKELYNTINLELHYLESIFNKMKFKVSGTDWFEVENTFSKSLLTNNLCNFRIAFNHLGRTLYNKYTYFDHNLEFGDENTYDQLLGFVEICMEPPQTIPLSNEYITWCKQHNKVPSGDYLNIGNIPNLNDNLTNYRQIIFRNTLQSNSFSIQLNKGN